MAGRLNLGDTICLTLLKLYQRVAQGLTLKERH